MEHISRLVSELMRCAQAETGNPQEGDYLRYQMGGYELTYQESREEGKELPRYDLTITPTYYTTAEEEKAVTEEVRQILKELRFLPWTSEKTRVKKIYDRILSRVSYDSIHKSSLYHKKSTAYAALFHHRAACQGYSVLAYRLLREAGIDCRVITGEAVYEGVEQFHAWNIVKIGNLYYNLDSTWDSRLGEDRYYMTGSGQFTDHSPGEEFCTESFQARYPVSFTALPR